MNLFGDSFAEVEGKTNWAQGWIIFYWAVWFAWTPITACFLGQISYGRTVREFMLVNFIFPALFGVAWMAIFSGSAINFELFGGGELGKLVAGKDVAYEMVAFKVFSYLPLTIVLVVFYVCSTFICFVTSADSNTTAMAAISSTGITPENSEGGLAIKIAWGVTVGLVAWVMISFADIEGIKIISTLGGFPACILMILVVIFLFNAFMQLRKKSTVGPPNRHTAHGSILKGTLRNKMCK